MNVYRVHRMAARRENSVTSLRGVACALGLAVAGVGAMVIAGWGLRLEAFTRIFPGYHAMMANAAAGLFLVGASVALQATARPRPALRRTARALAALAHPR